MLSCGSRSSRGSLLLQPLVMKNIILNVWSFSNSELTPTPQGGTRVTPEHGPCTPILGPQDCLRTEQSVSYPVRNRHVHPWCCGYMRLWVEIRQSAEAWRVQKLTTLWCGDLWKFRVPLHSAAAFNFVCSPCSPVGSKGLLSPQYPPNRDFPFPLGVSRKI